MRKSVESAAAERTLIKFYDSENFGAKLQSIWEATLCCSPVSLISVLTLSFNKSNEILKAPKRAVRINSQSFAGKLNSKKTHSIDAANEPDTVNPARAVFPVHNIENLISLLSSSPLQSSN